MGLRQRFDPRKAIEAILYVASHTADVYTVLKVLYFADKAHLSRYGRFITGDVYVAMRHGPVPSGAYDLIKQARGDGWVACSAPVEQAFQVEQKSVRPLRSANMMLLSASDVECLDESIAQYGHLSFSKLKAISHKDAAYQASDENDRIPVEAIAATLPDSSALLDYLRDA
jgi:uncharacterized phage-associated protein